MKKVEGPINGYKIFNSDFTNRYGKKFEIGKTYTDDNEITTWVDGNGFHFCENFYDTFRYFDVEEGFVLAQVVGSGNIVEYNDEYYGYLHMYSASNITIKRIVERNEIIEMLKRYVDWNFTMRKIFMTFPLTDNEFNTLLNSTESIYIKQELLKNYKTYQKNKFTQKV